MKLGTFKIHAVNGSKIITYKYVMPFQECHLEEIDIEVMKSLICRDVFFSDHYFQRHGKRAVEYIDTEAFRVAKVVRDHVCEKFVCYRDWQLAEFTLTDFETKGEQ